jgi:hypothetical protein
MVASQSAVIFWLSASFASFFSLTPSNISETKAKISSDGAAAYIFKEIADNTVAPNLC